MDVMQSAEFKALRQRVDALVHINDDEIDPALADLPKIPRMTQVSVK